MSPVHIERLEGRSREVLKVESGTEESIKLVNPGDVTVLCNEEDNAGIITPNLPKEVLTVKKFSSENDRNGIIVEPGRSVDVQGPQIVEITSRFYSQKYRIFHQRPPPHRNIGIIL